ncbi:MAG: biotin/lipoyl-binding protein [bacterium]|nr:biotin/lipoyl-binding protein [bacterium]
MKKRIILIVALVAVAAAFAARFQALGRTQAPASLESVQAAAGKPVEVVTAARGDIECWVALAGTVEGVVQYAVTSTNALRIVAIPVREGDRVKAGDVIVRLAREAPTPMVHSYARAQATYDNTLKDVQRLRALHAQGAISDQALDQAETRLKVAAADLQDVEGSTSLVAAQGGVVAGIVVNPGDTAEAGKPLVWIARTDDVKVCFTAGSRQALALAPGQTALDGSRRDRPRGRGLPARPARRSQDAPAGRRGPLPQSRRAACPGSAGVGPRPHRRARRRRAGAGGGAGGRAGPLRRGRRRRGPQAAGDDGRIRGRRRGDRRGDRGRRARGAFRPEPPRRRRPGQDGGGLT